MYSMFCENFRQYIKEHSSSLYHNAELLNILEPFYGLSDYDTYNKWRLRSDLRYYEASNLIYRLAERMDLAELDAFYQELTSKGYDSYNSTDFDNEDKLSEQIKLIYNFLTAQQA